LRVTTRTGDRLEARVERFGFDVIEEISLPEDGPMLWTMLRP